MSQSHTRHGLRNKVRAPGLFAWKAQSVKFNALSSAGFATVPLDNCLYFGAFFFCNLIITKINPFK